MPTVFRVTLTAGLVLISSIGVGVPSATAVTGSQYCASAKTELDKLNVFLLKSKSAVTAAAGSSVKLKVSMPPIIAQYRTTVKSLENTAPPEVKAAITTYLETLMKGLLVYEKVGFDAKKITPAMLPDPKKDPIYRSAVTKVAAFIRGTCKVDPALVLGTNALS